MAQNTVPVVQDNLGLDVQRTFLNFLQTFGSDADEEATPDYVRAVQEMKEQDRTTLYVDYNHLLEFDTTLAEEAVAEQFYRFEPYLRKAVQNFVKEQFPEYVEEENGKKEFFVAFLNLPAVLKLRELKTEKIGSLTSFSATVTRTSEVRPELLYGAFACMVCGTEVKDVEQQCKYTTPAICPNPTCNNRKNWKLTRDNSKFVDWQRVRVQENADEVPAGSLPRSMDVILRHETVEHARAGDKCIFTGSLMVVPDSAPLAKAGDRVEVTRERGRGGEGVSGLRSMGVRELHYRMVFLAHSVVNAAASSASTVNVRDEEGAEYKPTEEELAEIESLASDPALYEKLVNSVAPAVYGHADIKRAVLLMLFGGVHKTTFEGIQLRGDINVAIIGDPSCAKSQFLKYVASFLPRAVYTSGKSSSAAGLTATVVKDPETGEYAIEAGALMLADNGICCIDEFDKMDPKDQVAIHEAMEQQTISIAKAGISATLNARTSILAAANPAGGRYDKSKPLKSNLQLPPAILSRFDLVHIMLDEPDDLKDYNIAKHIVLVHQMKDAALAPPYSVDTVQRYIRHARSIKPRMGPDAQREVVRAYARLRSADAQPGTQTAYRITVRQLEAMIRLSEALARVDCAREISVKHVREARRLLQSSIISVEAHDVTLQGFDDEDEEEEMAGQNGGADEDGDADGFGGGRDGGDDDDGGNGGGGGDGGARRRSLAGGPAESRGASQGGAEGSQGASRGRTEGREGSPGAAPSQPQTAHTAQPQQLTVTYETFQRVKQLLALRLKHLETEAEAARAAGAAAPAAADAEADADAGRSTLAMEADAESLVGCRQGELVKWYLDERNAAGAFSSTAEMAQELKLVKTIINHLIKKDAVLNVIETPELPEGYDELDAKQQARARAQQLENRKLALNPNYVM